MNEDIHDQIRTKELTLVDNAGRARARLSGSEDGGVALVFFDCQESARAKIGLQGDGKALVSLSRAGGAPHFAFSVDEEGHALVIGYDNDGVERFKLDIQGNGSHTELSFSDKNKKPRMVLMSEDRGPAGLFILDHHGKALFTTIP